MLPFTWKRATISTTPGCVSERCGVNEIMTSFLLYAVYDGNFGAAGLGGGSAGATGGVKSNKLAVGGVATCGGAGGAGESKRLRMS
jgi:hypothetical protein